jgi:hypothetical protein
VLGKFCIFLADKAENFKILSASLFFVGGLTIAVVVPQRVISPILTDKLLLITKITDVQSRSIYLF